MKKFLSLFLVLFVAVGFSLTLKAEETFKIKDIFPNQKFADVIAKELGKKSDDDVSQEELDTITGATIVVESSNVDTIEGIGYLTNLKGLVLAGSNISEIPSEIGKLSNLAVLDINGSKITSIPNEISNLTNLVTLDLAQNEITSVTNDFSKLSKINEVNLSQNQISEYSSVFSTATKIDLNNNKLSSFPTSVLESTNLNYLDISHNKLSSLDMGLDNLTKLNALYINDNKITERVPNLALKFSAQIDKWSLTNNSQYVALPSVYLYPEDEFTSDDLLPELMKQVRENNSADTKYTATWYITKPSGGVAKQISATLNGDEFDSSDELFSEEGTYKIDFSVKNNSTRYWGYSTYSTEVVKVAKEKPTLSVDDELTLYVDEEKSLGGLLYNNEHSLEYSVLDDSIVKFENNLIKPVKVGETTITLWTKDAYTQSESVDVKVKVLPVPEFKIKDEVASIDMKVGDKINLVSYLDGSEGLVYNASSADDSIASIEDTATLRALAATQSLYIKANSVGETTITITASDNTRDANSKTLTINVTDDQEQVSDDNDDNDDEDEKLPEDKEKLPTTGNESYFKEIMLLVLLAGSGLLIVRRSEVVNK